MGTARRGQTLPDGLPEEKKMMQFSLGFNLVTSTELFLVTSLSTSWHKRGCVIM
jgi:hypothetical protein